MVLAGFALFIIALLIIGMPVAFTLSLAGILGIIQFVDMSTLSQVPVIAFKTLNSYVLTSVPLYILMSQIMLTGRWAAGSSTWAANGWATFPAAWVLPPSSPALFSPPFPAPLWLPPSPSAPWPFRKCSNGAMTGDWW